MAIGCCNHFKKHSFVTNISIFKIKKTMKKSTLLLLSAILLSQLSNALDRIVADGGAGGAFATITEAIDASSTNDRIIIYPKAGGVPYGENLTITNKSLQFLSAVEGQRWTLNGNITFSPTIVGQTLTIIEANILNGNITTTGNAPAGNRAKVRVLDCKLQNGSILFDFNNYDLNVSRDSLMNGRIAIRFGKIVGNYVVYNNTTQSAINVNTDNSASNDSLYIVGNKVNYSGLYYYEYTAGINWNSTSQFAFIANNFIETSASSYYATYGVNILTNATSTTGKNVILNNTILCSGVQYGIYLQGHNSYNAVYNNVLSGTSGIYSNLLSTFDLVSYNHIQQASLGSALINILQDGTNVLGSTFTNNSNGQILTGTPINGGYPDAAYYDLNLTVNDAGCFGGSYSRANFIGATSGAVASFMTAPRRVLAGQSITIQGEGFDK